MKTTALEVICDALTEHVLNYTDIEEAMDSKLNKAAKKECMVIMKATFDFLLQQGLIDLNGMRDSGCLNY